MKKWLVAVFSLALFACSSNTINSNARDTGGAADLGSKAGNTAVGGWAPVFFTDMDQEKLDSITDGLNNQSIKRVVISYPTKMQVLAQQIHDYLADKTHQEIPLKTIELKDTDQVKYNLTQVIVTLYFN